MNTFLRTLIKGVILFTAISVFHACIDRVDIPIPDVSEREFAVDGLITTEPGPYTVRLQKIIKIYGATLVGPPMSARKITLTDGDGNSNDLVEIYEGTYQTPPQVRASVGDTYTLRIEAIGGRVYESDPETIKPVGSLDSVYYKLVTTQPPNGQTQHGFAVFVNATNLPGDDSFVRWKFSGTYAVETLPQFYHVSGCSSSCGCWQPAYCSGYALEDGVLTYKFPCNCCKCWVRQYEEIPHVGENQTIVNGKFVGVQVGYIPINFYTFQEKYRVEVKQLSLTKAAYEFWNEVKAQKESAGTLFQPINGKIKTNFHEVNGSGNIYGFFSASAVRYKELYIRKSDVPVPIEVPIQCDGQHSAVYESCQNAFANSSNGMPDTWID